MLATLQVSVSDPMVTTMNKLAQIFSAAGWTVEVDPTSPVGDFWVTSPSRVGGNFPLVVKFVADTSSSSWERGINILLYRVTYPNREQPITFATTIVTGGNYTITINSLGFVITPPETQTHRFHYGTWAGLLLPFPSIYDLPPAEWTATPLFFTTDRILGSGERSERHINPTKATNFLQTPKGEVYDTFMIMHSHLGKMTPLERDRNKYILPLVFCVPWGEYVLPYLFAPTFFVEVNPMRTFYLPIESYKDFLKPRILPFGAVVACGELPPQGAILLALV